jgi:hypothetical protein
MWNFSFLKLSCIFWFFSSRFWKARPRLHWRDSLTRYCLFFNWVAHLEVHLHEIFRSGFLCWSNIYKPNNKGFVCFLFCSCIRRLILIFKYLTVAQLTLSLIPHQVSQRQVRLHVNLFNAEGDSTSTESTQNNEIFVNVGAFCIDSVNVESHSGVDSVDMESHSALTQLTGSLNPCQLILQKMNQAKTGIHNQLWRLERNRIYKN